MFSVREVFQGQIPLDNSASQQVLARSLIALDTNVLLDLYRYSSDTSAYFLELLKSAEERLWMPHHVGWEFLRRRSTVRASITEHHDQRLVALGALRTVMRNTGGDKTHVGKDDAEKEFIAAVQRYTDKLKKQKQALVNRASSSENDETLQQILDIFEGRTGTKPDPQWYEAREREGQKRFDKLIPPGYEDRTKTSNRYGDYFIWRECMEQSRALKKPLIFVTRDSKEDWWEKSGNNVVGPHSELLQEFWDETGQRVTLLSPTQLFDQLLPDFKDAAVPDQVAQAREEIVTSQEAMQAAEPQPLAPTYATLIASPTDNIISGIKLASRRPKINWSELLQIDSASLFPELAAWDFGDITVSGKTIKIEPEADLPQFKITPAQIDTKFLHSGPEYEVSANDDKEGVASEATDD